MWTSIGSSKRMACQMHSQGSVGVFKYVEKAAFMNDASNYLRTTWFIQTQCSL